MRILLISQYFTPEITAAPLRLRPLAAGLAGLGHEVEVICEVPSHPQGVTYPGFAVRPLQRRSLDGCRVTYVWAWPARLRSRPLSRLAAYGSYAASATLAGLASRRHRIVILASSPPLSVGVVGSAAVAPPPRSLGASTSAISGPRSPASSARSGAVERWRPRPPSSTGSTASAAGGHSPTTEPFRGHIGRLYRPAEGDGDPQRHDPRVDGDGRDGGRSARRSASIRPTVRLDLCRQRRALAGPRVAVEAARKLGPGLPAADPGRRRFACPGCAAPPPPIRPGRWCSATRCRRPRPPG